MLGYFDGKIEAVIDGGECGIGTESTIVTLADAPFGILRPGALPEPEIAARLAADMCIIGLTGPTGAGKTTALGALKALGALCIDADELYHELTRTDDSMRAEIVGRFGPVYDGDTLDRKALGKIVFADSSALAELNAITHKYVSRATFELLRAHAMAGGTLAAIDAIGIFEAGLDKICCAVFGVLAPRELRCERIMAREGVSRDYALSRIAAQPGDQYYIDKCSACLMNDGTAEEFEARCRAAFTEVISNGRKERLPRRALL